MEDGKCRARIVCWNDRGRRQQAGASRHQHGTDIAQAVSGRQAVIKTATSQDAVWLAGAYGVVNTVSLYVEHGQETFHPIHVEASSSFSLALRISLLAAALLAALVWILRLLARRLIRVLAGLSGLIALSILLTILVGIILFVIPSP
jgi:hypothetical protein